MLEAGEPTSLGPALGLCLFFWMFLAFVAWLWGCCGFVGFKVQKAINAFSGLLELAKFLGQRVSRFKGFFAVFGAEGTLDLCSARGSVPSWFLPFGGFGCLGSKAESEVG